MEQTIEEEDAQAAPQAFMDAVRDLSFLPYFRLFLSDLRQFTLSESLEVDFVLETMEKLIDNHGISLSKNTILHSDQGCHYTCVKFIQLLKNSALRQSMSRRGNCWDNALQESFLGHMKDELSREIPGWNSFADVERSIGDWIDYYNSDRYQWNLAKLSPNEYYDYLISGIYPTFP